MNPELKAQIDGMWTMTDINSNGEINFDEFFNFVKSGGEEAFQKVTKAFYSLSVDKNRNGSISRNEFGRLMKMVAKMEEMDK